MATVKKPSKNMIRGSWFGNATVTLTYLANNVVGVDLVQEYREALNDISHLYEDGDDLNRLIIGQAPVTHVAGGPFLSPVPPCPPCRHPCPERRHPVPPDPMFPPCIPLPRSTAPGDTP